MSDPPVWVPDEDLELEVIGLRKRIHELEGEVIRLTKEVARGRSKQLGLDPQKKRKWKRKRLMGPKLWTIDDGGEERQVWMFMTDVVAEGIGVVAETISRWIREGLIPEASYRAYDGKRLWTQAQVHFIFDVFERRRLDPHWRIANQEEVWREWPDGGTDVQNVFRKTLELPVATVPPKRKK